MQFDEKDLPVRVIELATGTVAVVAVLVFASVVGINAYLTYQPSALEAQVVNVTLPPSIVYVEPPAEPSDSYMDYLLPLPQPDLVYSLQ